MERQKRYWEIKILRYKVTGKREYCYNRIMWRFGNKKSKKNWIIRIYGMVQGVGFRWFIKEKAENLGISGYVKNMEDGSVFIEGEGGGESLEKFSEAIKIGTGMAKIFKITVTDGEVKGFFGFEIKHQEKKIKRKRDVKRKKLADWERYKKIF